MSDTSVKKKESTSAGDLQIWIGAVFVGVGVSLITTTSPGSTSGGVAGLILTVIFTCGLYNLVVGAVKLNKSL